jgi:hypothetical protein
MPHPFSVCLASTLAIAAPIAKSEPQSKHYFFLLFWGELFFLRIFFACCRPEPKPVLSAVTLVTYFCNAATALSRDHA